MKSPQFPHPLFLTLALALALSEAHAAGLQTFTDKAQFRAATGAASATGLLPNLGPIASGTVTFGTLAVTAAPLSGGFAVGAKDVAGVPDWYPGTPGNDMAFGFEDFAVESAAPIHALGFELVEPRATLPPWHSPRWLQAALPCRAEAGCSPAFR